jgi:head-tail adaptor
MSRARKYRHRIDLLGYEANTDGRLDDGWGGDISGDVGTTTPFATVWALIEPLKMGEIVQSYRTTSEASHQVEFRYLKGVNPSMRVRFHDISEDKTRVFFIESVINVGELDKTIRLICIEEL